MTTINEPLADARDMFAVHTMFRREFGLMPGLIRAVTVGDTRRVVRVRRRTPRRVSSPRTVWLSADCDTPSWAAARVKLCSRATIRKATRSEAVSRCIKKCC